MNAGAGRWGTGAGIGLRAAVRDGTSRGDAGAGARSICGDVDSCCWRICCGDDGNLGDPAS